MESDIYVIPYTPRSLTGARAYGITYMSDTAMEPLSDFIRLYRGSRAVSDIYVIPNALAPVSQICIQPSGCTIKGLGSGGNRTRDRLDGQHKFYQISYQTISDLYFRLTFQTYISDLYTPASAAAAGLVV